ncbi:ABC transporter permease [Heyndrickxia sp. NPDC080065]|uniref:ABC transporter permease n=1 Tax=Heyndrickxia sp. NPDC080065 TaxID=3390568 RepID=UPI003D08872D
MGKWQMKLSVVVLTLFVFIAIFGPYLHPIDPLEVNVNNKFQAPSFQHWMGTDNLGRDVFSRIILGTRISLGISLIAMLSVTVISFVIGGIAGYMGGWIDYLIMRICDTIYTFPTLILALCLIAIWGIGWAQMIIALITVISVYYIRIIRTLIKQQMTNEYVKVARISGSNAIKIMVKHILPGIRLPLMTMLTLEVGWTILDISTLSFLGFGVPSPYPEWGSMINESKSYIVSHPLLIIFPGMMILIVVMSLNYVGEHFDSSNKPFKLGSNRYKFKGGNNDDIAKS